jgi:hypothetical protein
MNIVAAIEDQERLAMSFGTLQEDRAEAVDEYYGRPYGDEVEGRSQVVMRDIHDTIEWIKPSLMKVFAAGDEIASFQPFGLEDEEQAQQETDYVNYVLMQKNNGFLILHDWFHDALLQKTGYVLVNFEEIERPERERYQNLTDDEFALLMQGEVELIEHEQRVEGGMTYHDAAVRSVKKYGCIRIRNIPPERVMVASDWPDLSLQDCPFVGVVNWETISDLRQAGYKIDDNINDSSSYNEDRWEEQRREVTFDGGPDREDIEADPSTRRVRVRRIWMRFDEDGDGIAELRRVVIVGTTVLENEEDDIVPVAAITPQRVPHEHYGISIADNVRDLQRIRTVLVRGFLDNMYLANNGRFAVDQTRVNLDDMLVSRPGGVVRTTGDPAGAIFPLIHPQAGGDILSAVEYIDSVRENRTGVTKYNQGLDANSLNKTASGVTQIMSAAQQRIEMIARIFAETGVKNLMLILHAMSIKNGRQPEVMKLRNKWVQVDPRSWKSRYDLSISVGIGTGNKDQMLMHLQMILQAQQLSIPLGLAQPKNIYNALTKLTQNAGFKEPELFWTEPPDGPMPPAPNPEAAKAEAQIQIKQMELQADAQKFQAEAQLRIAEIQAQAEAELHKLRASLEVQALNDERDADRARLQSEIDAQIEMAKAQSHQAIESAKLEMEKYRADLDASVKLQVAEKQAEQTDLKNVEQAIGELLQEVKAPKEVVRDASGRAVGVRQGNKVRKVKRDDSGKVVGVE